MRLLLVVLSVALVSLISDPAQAQTVVDYQYGSSGVGHDAATVAITASTAFAPDAAAGASEKAPPSNDPEAASVEESAATEVTDSEEGVAIVSLPETGGISPLSLSVLLVAGGVLIRSLTRLAFAFGD